MRRLKESIRHSVTDRVASISNLGQGRTEVRYWEPLPGVSGAYQVVFSDLFPSPAGAERALYRLGFNTGA